MNARTTSGLRFALLLALASVMPTYALAANVSLWVSSSGTGFLVQPVTLVCSARSWCCCSRTISQPGPPWASMPLRD